jgi:GntR family transcriptional regulator
VIPLFIAPSSLKEILPDFYRQANTSIHMSKEIKIHDALKRVDIRKQPLLSDKVSLTFQLFQILRDQILTGQLTSGTRLPPEIELAKDFGVSVVTVQRAMRDLSAAGLITRHRKRGTFVAHNQPAQVLQQDSHALSLMFSDEFGSDTKLLSREIIARPVALESIFPDQGKLLHIKRVVFKDGAPWSHASIYLLAEFDRKITRPMMKKFPMFRLLREQLGLQLSNVSIRLQARSAGVEVGHHLEINPLTPVTVLDAVLLDAEGHAVNAIEIHYRGDRFVFQFDMDLTRKGDLS